MTISSYALQLVMIQIRVHNSDLASNGPDISMTWSRYLLLASKNENYPQSPCGG